ncbi:DEAD/DEAH box helicase [Nocardioides sp. CFH 31398]|uniref:DEAD/DEAH box helicase n=1 Tax=Nocardioides sp. CFH 31398 TaxID=2919579 RepID=UPI001F053A70|nr:DEAD/DEAH box helicase [Nocardioides sp. CFH 31398]MCH1865616.1 DEAD/DEAH box helicase [Nocardioides sp. CFH 31398]
MSFVPLTGAAELAVADPPRDTVVTFTSGPDGARTVPMPMRAALPVLTRANARDDVDPSVALLAGAALLGVRLVAAARFEPGSTADGTPCWRVPTATADEDERADALAAARAYGDLDARAARAVVDQVVAAVVDAMPRAAPSRHPAPARTPVRRRASPAPADPSYGDRLSRRLASRLSSVTDERPQLVTLSLRVEADEQELRGGAVRLVTQVHDERNPLHLADAAALWTDTGPGAAHGFGDRARVHAGIALRAAAQAWPVLDRLLDLAVPDQITLDSDEIADLLEHGVEALRERSVDVLWPRSLGRDLTTVAVLDAVPAAGGRGEKVVREGEIQEGLLSTGAVFAFNWRVSLHGEQLTDAEMDELASATSPLLRLRGNWVVVDPLTARRARKRLLRTVPAVEAVAAGLSGRVEVEDTEEQVVVGATLERLRADLVGAATREPVPDPPGLEASLRGYQRHGLTWLADLTARGLGGCLADDMGLGKTLTTIALHLHRRAATGAPGATLVVCPTSLLGNWEAEVRRFAPGVPVRRFHGARRTLEGVGDGFVLTTYGTLRTTVDDLTAVRWDLVVADEAQHVKNPRSATARALRKVPSTARVALTGTPVENNLEDLWSVLDWACPGLLGSRLAFRRRWAVPIESGADPETARHFADLITPFLLRRRKSDPGIAPELPAKFDTDHVLGLTREQTVLYEGFVRDTMERIARSDPDHRRGLVLTLLTGLKQICNHPAQFLAQTDPRLSGRSEKLDLLGDLLGTVVAEGGAALVFTQYVAMARLVSVHLGRLGVEHHLLHGQTPVAERERMVASFQGGGVPVFLLSLKAGGTGLNLTRADHVVHVDRWWNPAVEDQATDRAHRIGRTRPVQVHRLMCEGTVEERIGLLLQRKRGIADSVLARGETALTELDDDALRDLVTLRRPDGG